MDPSSPNISSEGLPVAELDLNHLTNKSESEAHKIDARCNYVEDGSQLVHCASPILPSDVHYDGSISHSVMSDLRTGEPHLPSQSELSDDDGQRGTMDSEELSSPVKEPSFGDNNNHHEEVLNKEGSVQKSHELSLTDDPANVHSVDLSGSTKFGRTELYHEDADERNGDDHAKMEGELCSDKQHSDHEEDAPGESNAYFPRGYQERSTSPVERERPITPESPSHILASTQGETSSDVNHTRGSPYSNGSPRHEFSPSPGGPDKGRRRALSHDRLSPPKRRRSSSPVRQDIGDSDQRVNSPCERRSSSPGRTPQIDLYNRDGSPRKHLSVSPLREDSSRKHGSPKDRDSLRKSSPQRKDSSYRGDSPRWRDSPHRGDSPSRHDSPRRGDSPRRRNSPRKADSPTMRDSPPRGASPRRRDSPRRGESPRKSGSSRRRDSPRKRDLPGGDSPRKHISSSPRRQDSSRRKDRSMSRSPSGRRDSSSYRRDRHGRSRSRSPYGRDHHRRSPRRRNSPRRRSPSPAYHSRRHSPRRRPWSPPSNRSTGIGRPGKNLFVAGFSFVTTERDLEKKFSRYGRVMDVRIVRDKRSGDSRGFGFLSLERDEEADAAIRALDQTEWNGRIVLVEKAKTSVR